MPSLDRLYEFVSVVDARSISSAARALGLPRATLSRRTSALEAELGVRLLHRDTRRLVLTPAGEELYRRALRVTADADAAWSAVRRMDDVPRGLLRVSATGLPETTLFTDFVRDFSEVRLEVTITTRHVDLIAEGIDVAIRFGPVKDPSLVARRLWTDRAIAVASPAYLEARGRPRRAQDLAKHECLVGFAGDWAPAQRWPLLAGGTVPVRGRLAGNGIVLLRDGARAGLGIALLPRVLVARDLEDGTLVHVLAKVVGEEAPASIVYADREFLEPKVRVFVDRAVETFVRWRAQR